MRDVHDGHREPQVFLVLHAGRRARTWIYAIVHARRDVRTAGNHGWHNLGDRLFDLSQKTEAHSPALQANLILAAAASIIHTSIIPIRFNDLSGANLTLAQFVSSDRTGSSLLAGVKEAQQDWP